MVSDDDTQSELSQRDQPASFKSQPKPKYKSKVKRRSRDVDPLDAEIVQLIRKRKQDREELMGMSKMGANELFFQSCAIRANKLPPAKQALVQMQVSQILYQADREAATRHHRIFFYSCSSSCCNHFLALHQ